MKQMILVDIDFKEITVTNIIGEYRDIYILQSKKDVKCPNGFLLKTNHILFMSKRSQSEAVIIYRGKFLDSSNKPTVFYMDGLDDPFIEKNICNNQDIEIIITSLNNDGNNSKFLYKNME